VEIIELSHGTGVFDIGGTIKSHRPLMKSYQNGGGLTTKFGRAINKETKRSLSIGVVTLAASQNVLLTSVTTNKKGKHPDR